MSELLTPNEQRTVARFVAIFLSEFVNRRVDTDMLMNWIFTKGTMMTKREAIAFVIYLSVRYGIK